MIKLILESKFGEIVKRTVIATAHTCMDHVNATTQDLESLRDEPPYPEKSACIVKCLLEKVSFSSFLIHIKQWHEVKYIRVDLNIFCFLIIYLVIASCLIKCYIRC